MSMSVDELLNKYIEEEKKMRIALREKRKMISDIASDIGRSVSFSSIDDDDEATRKSTEIRPDTFFGKSHLDAVAQYIEMVGGAVHIDDALDALKRGGAPFTGGEPKRSLYNQLLKGNRRFVRIGENPVFGLRSMYPNLKKNVEKIKEETPTEESTEDSSKEENTEVGGDED